MVEKILNREDVKSFLAETITLVKYNQKEIPNTFSEEKIPKEQYCFYVTIDAIIKYSIFAKKTSFDDYFDQVKRIVKKLQTHNDMMTAMHRLIIKTVKYELDIKEENELTNKMVIQYIAQKYDQEGYFFHAFLFNGQENLMYSDDEVNQVEEIIKLFDQYHINHSIETINREHPMIYYTDSPFMAAFYAYNSPFLLYQLCIELIRKNRKKEVESNDFFFQNFQNCYHSLDQLLKKYELPMNEKRKVLIFFENQWKKYDRKNSVPVIACVKKRGRGTYNLSFKKDEDLATCVGHLLESRVNDQKLDLSVKPDFYIPMPSMDKILENSKLSENSPEENELPDQEILEVANSYGSANVVAILGMLFIALGVILMLIMIGEG